MSETDLDIEEIRARLLEAALPHAAFDGWTEQTLRRAVADAGLAPIDAYRAFPGGADDLLDFFLDDADRQMVSGMLDLDLENMRIRDKIASGIRIRLENAAPHKEAVRRGLNHLGLPHHAPAAMRSLYRTVDLMWRAIGDTSTDFNFYTKRTLLGGVYASTLLYWLNDRSEDHADTWAFLDRRIGNVMQIEKAKARFLGAGSKLPDPFRIGQRLASRTRRPFRT
ncbi:MAG: COQ9 family protein [Minwuia sp.]|uniref:COQ9 family protein n=1 Tax=Minwuia sp. TaxID=2493630 RepID=UPI003A8AA31F